MGQMQLLEKERAYTEHSTGFCLIVGNRHVSKMCSQTRVEMFALLTMEEIKKSIFKEKKNAKQTEYFHFSTNSSLLHYLEVSTPLHDTAQFRMEE